ncbi:glutathione S-transferase T2-like [Brassica napus]|uniref:glutathione S-transferase T2-like n=1 Tax=Brassica napus TaxID=3708 RepID=UPI00207A1D84|nr:glutathione S-transferase T2-like [Brassica napus]
MDSSNPYSHTSKFVDLLNCQQDCNLPKPFPYESGSQLPVFSTQPTETASFCGDSRSVRKERRKWPPSDDLVLISAWLNTSKDAVVSNEQKASTFWAALPITLKLVRRWQEVISQNLFSFCGSYAVATRQKTSGQSESDVVKLAHEIFFNDHKTKFNLHHAWEELRYDQKWSEHATSKLGGNGQKRKYEDGAETASSQATINLDEQPTKRPAGVKASKAASTKKPIVDNEASLKCQTKCSIKEKDLALQERVSKMALLNSLISKTDPLSEIEQAVKTKLLTEMLDN